MRQAYRLLTALALGLMALVGPGANAAEPEESPEGPDLGGARISRDANGVVHIAAATERDLVRAQGFVHAQDRFFQMDVFRRQASGRLAELLGREALAGDVEFRVLGVRRAAQRSLEALSPETRAALDAYAEGVNAFLAGHDLPPEYQALQVTKASVEPWTALDSVAVAKLIAFNLSFDLDDIARTETLLEYQAAGEERGFNGTSLFFEDINRIEPFTDAATIPDARRPDRTAAEQQEEQTQAVTSAPELSSRARDLARLYLERAKRLRSFGGAREATGAAGQSNAWAVSGRRTCSSRPILANDPHQDLTTPPLFYPIDLAAAEAGISVIGASIAGNPFVAFGHNDRIAWGAVVNQFDFTDVYQEQIVEDTNSPSGLSIVHNRQHEPVLAIPETFRVNRLDGGAPDTIVDVPRGTAGVPEASLIVPRRNNGPIVSLDRAAGTAISIQYVGFGPTRELDGFRLLNLAKDLDDFKRALRFLDVTGQNLVYADIRGTIGFFSTGEVPLREDLQRGRAQGAPPLFIRKGTGGNEWIRLRGEQPDDQAIPFATLPFAELPQIVNPPVGYVVTANNDPLGITFDNNTVNQRRRGGGILYLSPIFNIGIRAERITDLLQQRTAAGCVTVEDMKRIQADVVLLDAQYFTPFILRAFRNARARSAPRELAGCAVNPRVAEAVERLRAWNFSTPTGIREGFDANDDERRLRQPTPEEVQASVAATIYAVWRGQIVRNTIDATANELGVSGPVTQRQLVTALRNLLENFPERKGVGASGVDFFSLSRIENRCRIEGPSSPALAPEARRDIFILSSLVQALERLAGPEFENAFARSIDQDDYRWGKLHRVVLSHPLGDRFTLNAADRAFQPFGDDLPGAPTDGGFEVVDASSHSARADDENEFMFDDGPLHRYVAELGRTPGSIRADYSLPGGVSGVPGSPFFANLFRGWLTNEYFALRQR